MSEQKVSPALSKLEIRLKQLNDLRTTIGFKKAALNKYKDHVKKLEFLIGELEQDKDFLIDVIVSLEEVARKEGYSEKEIDRFIKNHNVNLNEIKSVD